MCLPFKQQTYEFSCLGNWGHYTFAFSQFLASQVRESRTSYRLDPDLEDDITLLLVSYEQRTDESHTGLTEASRRTG